MRVTSQPQLNEPEHEAPASEPQFRVLVIDGHRKAFRLEAAFWAGLELFAERSGRNLAGEVEARLADSPPELNHSSALRASLARDLLDGWREAEAKLAQPQCAALVAAIPSAAFAVTARSRLTSVNAALLGHLQRLSPACGAPVDTVDGALQLSVEIPASAFIELAHDPQRRFVTCQAVFRAQARRLACRVRLVPVDGHDVTSRSFLGFLEADPGV
jgi:predicted DNA-binding ribbon-helix-helix protein